jgi:hypothetical protein
MYLYGIVLGTSWKLSPIVPEFGARSNEGISTSFSKLRTWGHSRRMSLANITPPRRKTGEKKKIVFLGKKVFAKSYYSSFLPVKELSPLL